jgi:hypothetical protein
MTFTKCTRAKAHRGVDVISDVLPFGALWYGERNAASNAIRYAKFRSRSHNAVIRVYDEAGNVIETHERASPSSVGCLREKEIQSFTRSQGWVAVILTGDSGIRAIFRELEPSSADYEGSSVVPI